MSNMSVNAMPFDKELEIAVPGTVVAATGQVGADLDLKGDGFGKGTVVVCPSVLKTDATDETYVIDVEMDEDDGNGAPAGNWVKVASVTLTEEGITRVVPFNNQGSSVKFRHLRLMGTLGGTSPSVTLAAYVSESIK